MTHLRIKKSYQLFTVVLTAYLGFWCCQGCSRPGEDGTSVLPASDETSPQISEDAPSLDSLKAPEEFEQLKDELCQGLASLDYLTQRTNPFLEPDEDMLCTPSFPDLSEVGWNQHMDLVKSLKFQLKTIDPALLNPDQQVFYDILSFYSDQELSMAPMKQFRLLCYLSPQSGLMVQIPRALNAIPFSSRQDVEDYLLLLSDLPRLFNDLIDLCREEAGQSITFTSQWLLEASSACAPYILPPEHNSLASSFSRRLDGISDLTQEERAAYEARNQEAVIQYVIPAYQTLSQNIRSLSAQPKTYEGLCGQKNGRDYYHCLIFRSSGTSYSNIHQLKQEIEEQLQQNVRTLNQLLDDFPIQDQVFPAAAKDPVSLLRSLKEETDRYFPSVEAKPLSLEVVPVEMEDLWQLPCLSYTVLASGQPERTSLLINQHTAQNQELLYDALSSTGFPGKYYRENYLKNNPDMPLLSLLQFPGWEKGWDLYGRSYAISFENGLQPEEKQLARLSLSSFMAVHALIDIQVNYYGWGLEEVQDFLTEYYGLEEEGVGEQLYQNAVYSPGESVIEYTGYLEIRQMKAQAIEHLGDSFDECLFHQFLLDTGPAPFSRIRRQLSQWISRQSLGNFIK